MSFQVVALAAGLGLTVETVLLVALAERRNRRTRQAWMVMLAASAWCWHAGAGGYFLLEGIISPDVQHARWAAMTLMIAGLLGMPCSLLHAVVRLTTTGWFGSAPPRHYEPFLYAPVLLTAPIALSLHADANSHFIGQVEPLVLPYLGVTAGVSLLTAAVLWRKSNSSEMPAGPLFLRTLSLVLLTMTAVLDGIMLIALPTWPDWDATWYAILVLLPLPPAVLFAYFVLRYGFLPLVLERTVVYGGILAGVALVHRSAVAPWESAWRDRAGIDLLWIEFAGAVMLVAGYQPVRRRVRESLRYLTSTSVRPFRRAVRELAMDLAAHGGNSPDELFTWFLRALQSIPGIAAIQIEVRNADGTPCWSDASESLCPRELLDECFRAIPSGQALSADQLPNRALSEALFRARIAVAVRTSHAGLHNLWLLRPIPGAEAWADEELNALVLLAEQWVAALRHCVVQGERTAAERRAWQAEKLSAVGLLAGSLAHEIKNPLSSIKTLTTVALEDAPQNSELAESLRLVLAEIDRLSSTTRQLLNYVRTGTNGQPDECTSLAEVVPGIVQMVQHRARQQQINIAVQLPEESPCLAAPRMAVQSLLLNLLLNAVEACPTSGVVEVIVNCQDGIASIEVRDNGPGIPPAILDRLFEPLITTKPDGTGLGLYSVAQTVRDLGGEISVESQTGCGTTFRVLLKATSH